MAFVLEHTLARVYLDFLTRGFGRSVGGNRYQTNFANWGGNRPNQFCKCAIVGLRTTFYIAIHDVNMTTIDKMHDAV